MSLILLLVVLIGVICIVAVVFAIGAAIYEFGINKRTTLDEQYYTRSHDWKTSDH